MPKIVNHAQHREKIITKCFELFSKKGFNQVSMREIASEMDVSIGAFYHYFPTKQAIFEELMDHYIKKDIDFLREATNIDAPPEERMVKAGEIIENNTEFYQNLLLLIVDFIRQSQQLESEKVMTEFAKDYIQIIAEQIELSDIASNIIFCWLIGLIYVRLVCPSLLPINEEFSTITSMMRILRDYSKQNHL